MVAAAVDTAAAEVVDIGDNSSFFLYFFVRLHSSGELAHLVERLHGMQKVTGSIPVFSTKL